MKRILMLTAIIYLIIFPGLTLNLSVYCANTKSANIKNGLNKEITGDKREFYQTFKNPFKFREKRGQLIYKIRRKKVEQEKLKIKKSLPFILKGIINTGKDKLALIYTAEKTKLLKIGDNIKDYRVVSIGRRNVGLKYKDSQFNIEIGGN